MEKLKNGELGSIILATSSTVGNDKQISSSVDVLNEFEKIAAEQSRSKIPVIIGRDVIHGHRTVMPAPLALAATLNTELAEKAYNCIAEEAAVDGIQWSFSPMLDISRDPRWGRCVESPGEDPYLGAQMASAVVKGFQKCGIAACAKHYIGYSATEGGRDYGKSEISDYTLRNTYLPPFKAAIDAGVATVMTSFSEISGSPVTSSKYLLTELLKNELGFDGFTVSDWGAVGYLTEQGVAKTKTDAAELAINSGLDMDMASKCFLENLETLVNDGKVPIDLIDRAAERIIYIKLLFGLFDNPYTTQKYNDDFCEHLNVSKQCSDEAIVLLKNKNNILPVSKCTKLIVTEPMLYEKGTHFGTWTLDGDESLVPSIADILKEKSQNIGYPTGPYLWEDCLGRGGVENFDAVAVFLGESRRMSGEDNSMSHAEIPNEQKEYVKRLHRIGKPLIGVLSFARPVALGDVEHYFDAIVYTWHSGTCAAESIADFLYGDVNPSGCLPMTFPRSTGQIPIYYNYPNGRTGMYYYDENIHKYRDEKSTPLYPFGYGLSYTEFEYSNIECNRSEMTYDELKSGNKFIISITVRSTGSFDGMKTTQCYIHDRVASMTRPIRELKGFSKDFLPSGKSKKIVFEIGFNELAFYDGKGIFDVERGEFQVFVGANCLATTNVNVRVV